MKEKMSLLDENKSLREQLNSVSEEYRKTSIEQLEGVSMRNMLTQFVMYPDKYKNEIAFFKEKYMQFFNGEGTETVKKKSK